MFDSIEIRFRQTVRGLTRRYIRFSKMRKAAAMALRFNNTISNLMRRLVGRNNETPVRYTRRSLLTVAHQSFRRSVTRLAFACAVAIVPRMALGDPIIAVSPTVIIDTTGSPTGHAFFVEPKGIYEDVFTALGWTNPVLGGQHGNGTSVDQTMWVDNMVWIPWTDNGVPRINGFFNFEVGRTILLGTPWMVLTNNNPVMPWQFNWATMTPPDAASTFDKSGAGFVVESGFAWSSGRIGRLNIFGMTSPAKNLVIVGSSSNEAGDGLRELWWDGSQWNWSDHGRPPGIDTVALGRNSAVWDHVSQQGRVFVVGVNSADPGSLPQLWDRFWDGSQWSWTPLGNPFGTSTGPNDQVVRMWSPVAVDGVQSGTYVVTAFVVGLRGINLNSSNPQYRYELYAREKIGSAAWSDWIQLGSPTHSPFTDFDSAGATRFVVDQGARWMDGNLLRGSLFGSTQFSNAVPDANRLVHLFRDNSGWQWDTPILLPQPPGGGLWIDGHVSCAVLTKVSGYPGWHLTALMRGDADTIWNREYDSNTAAWTWRKLQ
jgi:hypothetical protein